MKVKVFLLLREVTFRVDISKSLLEELLKGHGSQTGQFLQRFHIDYRNPGRSNQSIKLPISSLIIIMSKLTADSTRKIPSALPFQRPLHLSQFYHNGRYDVRKILDFFSLEGKLSKDTVLEIIKRACKILKMEPNLLKVTGVVWVFGDIHGQFYDLAHLCLTKVDLQRDTLLFLGDYVDRGNFSIQVMLSLLVMKLNRPQRVFLLRGNHQCQQMTSYFNFYQECLKKYDQEAFLAFIDLFNCLPLAATINSVYLCLHGGISANLVNIRDIARINRFQEISNKGLFCDLMWADPTFEPQGDLKGLQIDNIERGCSYIFGRELTEGFLKENQMRCIIRGHQAEENGYRLFGWAGEDSFPMVITVFSAPNYCDFYNNKGSCLHISEKEFLLEQYSEVEHPYLLPDFMDTFQWSFPFVAQKIGEMMFHLLQPDRNTAAEEVDFDLIRKLELIRKILSGHQSLANSNIEYTHLAGRSLDSMLAHDELAIGYLKNKSDKETFEEKRSIDLKYEKRPLKVQQW